MCLEEQPPIAGGPADAVVYIVDDEPSILLSLPILTHSIGLRAETFDSARAFLAAYDESKPGCLVLDIQMPGMNGLELLATLRERGSELPVVVITGQGDVPTAAEAMRAGAIDIIEKPCDTQALLDRINQGVQRDIVRREKFLRRKTLAARLESLTIRERQIMSFLVAGKSVKEIAQYLHLSPKTVQIHRGNVLRKAGVESVAQLIWLTIEAGEYQPDLRPRRAGSHTATCFECRKPILP